VKLVEVDHALRMMRTYLVEYAAQDEWSDRRTEELADVIRACVRRIAAKQRQQTPLRQARLSYAILRQAIRFVNDNLDSQLKWDDIAAEVGLAPYAFGRGFKLATGMTPHQYIIRCRLRRAMKLMARSELSLVDISFEVGCSCQSHLSNLFRKHLGTTPGSFRLSVRNGKIAGTLPGIAGDRQRIWFLPRDFKRDGPGNGRVPSTGSDHETASLAPDALVGS
jgi:transcriptional regulator GlxA family with amidase domain